MRLVLSHGLHLQFDAVDVQLGTKYNLGIGTEYKEIYFLKEQKTCQLPTSQNAQNLER